MRGRGAVVDTTANQHSGVADGDRPALTEPAAPTDRPASTDPAAPTDRPALTDAAASTDPAVPIDPAAPTDHPAPTDQSVITDLAQQLARLFRAARCSSQAIGADVGVTVPHSGLLRLLSVAGELRVSEITERQFVDASVVSRQLRQLEDQQLITRRTDPQDKRASLVSITPAGIDLLIRVDQASADWLNGALADWSPADLTAAGTLLAELADSIGDYVAARGIGPKNTPH